MTPTQPQDRPTYRPWESRYSPNNQAALLALRLRAHERAHQRRNEREVELQAARKAQFESPTVVTRREAALDATVAVAARIPPPQRQKHLTHPQPAPARAQHL